MKTTALLLALLTTAAALHAQQPSHGSPAPVITAQKIYFATDLNGDSSTDVIAIDRATGSYLTGTTNVQSQLVWSDPMDTGLTGIESAMMGRLLSTTTRAFAVSSRQFNRVQPVPLDGSDLPGSISLSQPEPVTLASLDAGGGQISTFVTGYRGNGGIEAVNTGGFILSLWMTQADGLNARHARPIYPRYSGTPLLGLVTDAVSGPLARLRFRNADNMGTSLIGELADMPADIRFTAGLFTRDLASIGINFRSATVLAWSPTDSLLRTARLTDLDWVQNTGLFDVTLFPLPSYDLGRLIKEVHVLDTMNSRFLVIWGDAAGGAGVFGYDGINAPALVEAVPLNGLSLDTALPLVNGGDFLLMGSRDGHPVYDRIHWDGSHFTRITTGTIPDAPKTPLYSNVVSFNAEPSVNPDASELGRRRVKDWPISAAISAGMANVTSLSDGGASAGLGAGTSRSIGVPTDATHALVSQLDPASSIMFLTNTSTGTAKLPHVVFSPPPGHYSGTSLVVTITTVNSSESGLVRHSVNDTDWVTNGSYQPISVTLSGDSTLRAFARNFSFGPASSGGQGPISTGVYTFGTLPPVQKQPLTDANANGLSDAWENLTGITNPGGDADGDGFLNLAEHNSGFDPLSALSKPDAVAAAPNLNLFNSPIPAQNTLRWNASDTAVILEGSDDLQTWSVVTQGITRQGGENVFTLPVGVLPKAFYRLRR